MNLGLSFRRNFLLLGDILLFLLALIISLLIGFGKDFNSHVFLQHLFPFSILLLFWLFFFAIEGGYDLYALKNNFSLIGKVVFLFIFIIVSSSLFFYFFKNFQITPKQNLINFLGENWLFFYIQNTFNIKWLFWESTSLQKS